MLVQTVKAYLPEIMVVVGALLSWGLARFFRLRPKLIFNIRHAFTYLIELPSPGPDGSRVISKQSIQTASVAIRNEGSEAAHNVEISFNWKPQHYNIWPQRPATELPFQNDRFALKFDSLAPREECNIELLAANAQIPAITSVRSDEAKGRSVQMELVRTYSPPVRFAIVATMLIGVGALFYLFGLLVQRIA